MTPQKHNLCLVNHYIPRAESEAGRAGPESQPCEDVWNDASSLLVLLAVFLCK